jgi:hypothetical protein
MNPFECNTSSYNQTDQANYRATAKSTAAGFGTPAKVLDLYDQWSAMGVTGNSQANTEGFLVDLIHESQKGHNDIANRVYWWLRTQFLASYTGPTSYTARAKQDSKQYAASQASVQYSAAPPTGLIPT